ncbi:MAG TPA: fused MFS/spermidine synthase [Bryobacteraceae bacterium]|nr:fused MFS/spermidine synthase [Bryobacteraceae bacterium]
MLLYAATIFLSAFLLFSLEPLIARRILPWFGGSAAVWSTCLVFYQTALLAGYFYARLLTRRTVHLVVLGVSLLFLPIGPGERWRTASAAYPSWLIFGMLTVSVAVPFAILSATSPLLQSWLPEKERRNPYRLFALSNFASLAALLAYPLVIEPILGTRAQLISWSLLYAVFAILCAAATMQSHERAGALQLSRNREGAVFQPLQWFLLAACGSMLLLSITNHIDENVAAVPLLWVVPLAIYLLSFVLTFGAWNIYRRALWMRLLAFVLGILGYAIYNISAVEAIQVSLPIFLAGLLVCCLFCHGELNRLRPATTQLTGFYLTIAAGGAAGAIFVGLLAPVLFEGIYELPLTLMLTALLALALTWADKVWALRLLWCGVTACMLAVTVADVKGYHENTLSLRRSFYGSLRVVQTPHIGVDQQRQLFHGTIEHGSEFLFPARQRRPTTYYGPESGIGILLRECFTGPKRVGIIGLGAGTLAAYGQPGDDFHFFEINPQIVDMAQALFFYLQQTPARHEITIGDGRLSLERDQSPPYDALVLDAFSGDAIPVHLLTKEAVALYRRHLKSAGTIAFHVSNDFLDLAPVVKQLAAEAGFQAVLVHNHRDDEEAVLPSDWVLVTNNPRVLHNPAVLLHEQRIAIAKRLRLWTDDYNNLFQVIKTAQIHP